MIVNFRIHPNPKWQRNGLNLTTDLQVSIWDCLAGGDVEAQDILGNKIALAIPPSTQPNSLLRLKGKGLRSRDGQVGDLLVRVSARVPTPPPIVIIAPLPALAKNKQFNTFKLSA